MSEGTDTAPKLGRDTGIYPSAPNSTQLFYWNGSDWDPRPVAATGVRVLCNVVDILLVGILWFLLLVPLALLDPSNGQPDSSTNALLGFLGVVIAPLVAFVGYFTLQYRYLGQSVGMMLGRLQLVHIPSGSTKLPWGAAIARSLALGAGYICGVSVFLWLALTATSKTKQGPHDRLARTAVLRDKPTQVAPVSAPTPTASATSTATSPADATVTPAAPAAPVVSTTPQGPMIFISHATEDAEIARGLSAALEAEGVRTWLASRDVAVGANYAAEIVRAVSSSQYLLVLLSPAGIESPHVRREVSIAIDRKVPVLPVSTDPTGEFMAELPVDWTYWLSLAQVLRMSDEEGTAREIARRISLPT